MQMFICINLERPVLKPALENYIKRIRNLDPKETVKIKISEPPRMEYSFTEQQTR